jgi:hypothetical protein
MRNRRGRRSNEEQTCPDHRTNAGWLNCDEPRRENPHRNEQALHSYARWQASADHRGQSGQGGCRCLTCLAPTNSIRCYRHVPTNRWSTLSAGWSPDAQSWFGQVDLSYAQWTMIAHGLPTGGLDGPDRNDPYLSAERLRHDAPLPHRGRSIGPGIRPG